MSVKDLMEDVRNGKFEKKFKNCNSINKKIELFQNYGMCISVEQYKIIESRVSAIKEGIKDPYYSLENKVEGKGKMNDISKLELQNISAGKNLNNREEDLIFKILQRMPQSDEQASETTDKKFWDVAPFLSDKGLF